MCHVAMFAALYVKLNVFTSYDNHLSRGPWVLKPRILISLILTAMQPPRRPLWFVGLHSKEHAQRNNKCVLDCFKQLACCWLSERLTMILLLTITLRALDLQSEMVVLKANGWLCKYTNHMQHYNPLRYEMKNVVNLTALQCSAGKTWILVFMWMLLNSKHLSTYNLQFLGRLRPTQYRLPYW